MSYVVGVLMLLVAGWLFWDGSRHDKIAKSEEQRIEALKQQGIKADTGAALHPSLAGLVLVAPAVASVSALSFGGLLVLAWLMVGRGTWFTAADLAGCMIAVIGYAYWINARTKLRQVQLDLTA